jgi:hypothetical protein
MNSRKKAQKAQKSRSPWVALSAQPKLLLRFLCLFAALPRFPFAVSL